MQRRVILIFGKTGSGKSTLSKKIIQRFGRVVVFDPLHEYHGFLLFSYADFIEYFSEPRESFSVVCRFTDDEDYEKAAKACWYLENMLLVLEEVEHFINSYDRQSYINYLISFGRHRGISIMGIGRNPVDIPIKMRAQCSTIFSFQQTEPPYVAYLEKWGFSPQQLQTLNFSEHEYAVIGEPLDKITSQAVNSLAQWQT